MKEIRVLSSDGAHTLAGRVYEPRGEVKGMFHVVHGMTEHIGRYETFMEEMAQNGFLTFGYDHLGHGNTARDKSELGYIADKDGWRYLADDVAVFGKAMEEAYGKTAPYVLMGHSMGSFIVRLTAARYPDLADKLIVMGTGGPNPAAGAGLAVIRLLKLFKGGHGYSDLVEKLAFGTYNSHFRNENDPLSWLTKDRTIRERYARDTFCTFRFTLSAMQDLITLNARSNAKNWAEKIACPVLLVSGADDPVGDYGAGVKAVNKMLQSVGKNVTMRLYENCRHEILNDTARKDVIRDILSFAGEA